MICVAPKDRIRPGHSRVMAEVWESHASLVEKGTASSSGHCTVRAA